MTNLCSILVYWMQVEKRMKEKEISKEAAEVIFLVLNYQMNVDEWVL